MGKDIEPKKTVSHVELKKVTTGRFDGWHDDKWDTPGVTKSDFSLWYKLTRDFEHCADGFDKKIDWTQMVATLGIYHRDRVLQIVGSERHNFVNGIYQSTNFWGVPYNTAVKLPKGASFITDTYHDITSRLEDEGKVILAKPHTDQTSTEYERLLYAQEFFDQHGSRESIVKELTKPSLTVRIENFKVPEPVAKMLRKCEDPLVARLVGKYL